MATTPTPSCNASRTTCTVTFTYAGDYYMWPVPADVRSMSYSISGAQGGRSGGNGTKSNGTFKTVPTGNLYIYVGGQGSSGNGAAGGYNGGGQAGSGHGDEGSGGGATDIRTGTLLTDRVAVAAGGGGTGGWIGGTGGSGAGTTGTAGGVTTIQTPQSQEAQVSQAEALNELTSRTKDVRNVIGETKKLISGYTTGYGSLLSGLPLTDAKTLQNNLDSIKANLSLSQLTALKEASKTGASGLGQVTRNEFDALQSTIAKLDPQSKTFADDLDKVDKTYARLLKQLESKMNINQSEVQSK